MILVDFRPYCSIVFVTKERVYLCPVLLSSLLIFCELVFCKFQLLYDGNSSLVVTHSELSVMSSRGRSSAMMRIGTDNGYMVVSGPSLPAMGALILSVQLVSVPFWGTLQW